MCVAGTHSIQYIDLNKEGKMVIKNVAKDVPGRILSFQDDPVYHSGVLILTDDVKDSHDYKEMAGCILYTFPLKADENSQVTLYSLKFQKFHALLKPDDDKRCLNYDS